MTGWLRWAALVAAVVVFVAVAQARREPGEDPHTRFARGECADCHAEVEGGTAGAPRYHEDPAWLAVHGRGDRVSPARCQGCHAPDACRECHQRPPDTHTAAFVRPEVGGPGARRHAMLGGLRPEGCATCHDQIVSSCVGCHTVDESRAWAEAAAPLRRRWTATGGLR